MENKCCSSYLQRKNYATIPPAGQNDFGECSNNKKNKDNKSSKDNTLDSLIQKKWTLKENPTPYDVLYIENKREFTNRKFLRKRFHKLCKLYHPDITGVDLLKEDNSLVTEKERLERFKMIQDAYTLLNTPAAKTKYDTYNLGWAYANTPASHNTTKSPYDLWKQQTANQDTHNMYWNAGNWEDYHNYHQRTGNPDHIAIHGKKLSHWDIIVYVLMLGALGESFSLLTDIQTSFGRRVDIHEQCEKDLIQSYLNYGLGDDYWARIRRFLWFRSFNLYSHSKEDLDREAIKNEKIIGALKGRHEKNDLSPSSSTSVTKTKQQLLQEKKVKNKELKKKLQDIEDSYAPNPTSKIYSKKMSADTISSSEDRNDHTQPDLAKSQ
ncbi:hypothetical protein ACO0QE_003291 [Hanseniaspora vineae]